MPSPDMSPNGVQIRFSDDRILGPEAMRQVWFDVESLTQVIRAHDDPMPEIWLARPEGYVEDAHVLRDSEAIRLVAGSSDSLVLCATDGCNTCRHALDQPLKEMTPAEVDALASRTQIPRELLAPLLET